MKVCLFSLSYLDGIDGFGSSRLERQIKYVNFYKPLKQELGFRDFAFYDNGSSLHNIQKFQNYLDEFDLFQSSNTHLPRKGPIDYPYCWMGLYFLKILIRHWDYDKIICIDSDGFVLSKRLASYIKNCNSGWEAFWNKKYQFPTAELHIINRDKFDYFLGFTSIDFLKYVNGKVEMERFLPFTQVNKNFNTERFGEDFPEQEPHWDFCGQTPVSMEINFKA